MTGRDTSRGSRPVLAPQQEEIRYLRAEGRTNKEVAEILGLSPRTVRGVVFELRRRGIFVRSCRRGMPPRGGVDHERNRERRRRKYASARAAGLSAEEARKRR